MDYNYPKYNRYVGRRYVPKQCGTWDNTKNTEYESLSVVQYGGASYTSKTDVPPGIDINDGNFWVLSGNYNAQVEDYRLNVVALNTQYNALSDEITNSRDGESNLLNRIRKMQTNVDEIMKINSLTDTFTGETIKITGEYTAVTNGTYSTGNPIVNDGKYYILLQNLQDKTLDFAKDCVINLDCSEMNNPSVIMMVNCKNVHIKNLRVNGINQLNMLNIQLTQGNAVYMVKCENCVIEDGYFKDTPGGGYILSSKNCHFINCNHEIKKEMQTNNPHKYSTSSFVISQSDDCTIRFCTSYGATGDGNFFLGGGVGQRNCHIMYCMGYGYAKDDTSKAINFIEGQCYCIDGSNYNCSVKGCYAYGFAYGVDVKNFAYNTMVVNNIIQSCYNGIAVRPGDQGITNTPDIFGCLINGNIINPDGGNGANEPMPKYSSLPQDSIPHGIIIHDGYGTLATNNTIENTSSAGNKNFIHVAIYLEKNYLIDKNQQGIIIRNNRLNANTKRYTEQGFSTEKMIVIHGKDSCGNVVVDSNEFTPYFDNINDVQSPVVCNIPSYMITFTNNNFTRVKGSVVCNFANMITLIFKNNTFDYHSGILQVSGTSNVIVDNNSSWGQQFNQSNKIYNIESNGNVIFTNNTYTDSSGSENNFFNSTGTTAKVVCNNNVCMGGYVTPVNMIKITATNKVVNNNFGSVGENTLTSITG